MKPSGRDPASVASLASGCTCPVSANSDEREDGEPFWIHDGCIHHGWSKDARYSRRVRFRFGHWWIDELTNPLVVFVCGVASDYYVAMDQVGSDERAHSLAAHVRQKRWCRAQYGVTGDEGGDYAAHDLDHAIKVGRDLQALRSRPGEKTRRWDTVDPAQAAAIVEELDTSGEESRRVAASVLRAVHAKGRRETVVVIGKVVK